MRNSDWLHLFAYSGAFIGSNDGGSLLLGFVVLLVDVTDKARILSYGSPKSKTVMRSVGGDEYVFLANTIDEPAIVRSTTTTLP